MINCLTTIISTSRILQYMKLSISPLEIQSFIYSKTGRNVVLSFIDRQTMIIETKLSVKMPIIGEISKILRVILKIEELSGNVLKLRYEGKPELDKIIGGVLTVLSKSQEQALFENTPENGIVVHLNNIKEVKKLLENIELIGIEVQPDNIIVEGRLK